MRDKIITFLEKLSTDFKNDTLSEENKKLVTDFFVTFECVNSDIQENVREKEILKYFFLGWYIYNNQSNQSK